MHITKLDYEERLARIAIIISLGLYNIAIFATAIFPFREGDLTGSLPEVTVAIFAAIGFITLITRLLPWDLKFDRFAYLVTSTCGFFSFWIWLLFATQFTIGLRISISAFMLVGVVGGAAAYIGDGNGGMGSS